MKKTKILAFILTILSCICLFGIGYSMWYNVTINFPNGNKKSGVVESYEVLEIANTDMTIFKFSMLSFKTGDAKSPETKFENTDTGIVTVTYTVDAATLEKTNNSFRVDAALGYDAATVAGQYPSLFGQLSVEERENNCVAISCDEADPQNVKIVEGKEIQSSFEFTDVSANDGDDFTFTVTYTFTIKPDNDNFRQVFGQYLMGADKQGDTVTKFIASASIFSL